MLDFKGKLIVFSAPSGSGKTTIVRHLLHQEKFGLEFSISAASRDKRGAEEDGIPRIFSGRNPGTFFVPSGLPMDARKHWLTFFQRPKGSIQINAKAVPALRSRGSSLLAVGVTGCSGTFASGDIIDICDPDGTVVGRGKSTFASDDIPRIAGLNTPALQKLFPKRRRLEVLHRNDLVLI